MIAEFEHFSALSGLTPPEEYSLADHKRAYYTGGLSASLNSTLLPRDEGLSTAPPPDDVTLRHDFSVAADTAPGSIGTPDVGPGGAWAVTGPGVATARVLDGEFISPDAVTYASKLLGAIPTTVVARNKWTGASGPTVALISQTTLDIATMSGLHIQTTKTALNPFIFDNGSLRVPEYATVGTFEVPLSDGVEYDTRVDVDLPTNTYVVTVTRVSDGLIMGQTYCYDSELTDLAGPLLFIEPGANVGYTMVEAYSPSEAQAVQHIRAPRGITGVIGAVRRLIGLFSQIGVGTSSPRCAVDVVSASEVVALMEGSHPSGGFVRVGSSVAARAGLQFRANNGSIIPRIYQQNATNELRFANNNVDALEISSGPSIIALRNFYPATPASAKQTATAINGVSGVPSDATGINGHWCFSDNGHIYFKTGGAWVEKI